MRKPRYGRYRLTRAYCLMITLSLLISPISCATPEGVQKTAGDGSQKTISAKVEDEGKMQVSINPQEEPHGKDRIALLFDSAIRSLEGGKEERAIEELQEVLLLSPRLSVPHNNLGILYKRKGLLDKAIEEYQEAVRLNPDYAEAHNNLGIAYREKGLFHEAETAYLNALRLSTELAEAHYNLGILYDLYLNQPADAIEHYRRYLGLNGEKKQTVELWISILEKKVKAEQP